MPNPRRNPEIIWRIERRRRDEVLRALEAGEDVGDSGTVLLIEKGTMHQLNLVGGMIWERCDGTRDPAQIAAELAVEFAVERGELQADVDEFVKDLTARGWLLDA
ncbi:MAG: pyrroloquinoline quinone biosynthesis peptide chaperone PqqD [Deltaproteobacteria bacterium]|nr:MAG: pyrroloquinoline quinone biosynthesis peptide chaperone PqqD [Deltaproteobacteria bacterium]